MDSGLGRLVVLTEEYLCPDTPVASCSDVDKGAMNVGPQNETESASSTRVISLQKRLDEVRH